MGNRTYSREELPVTLLAGCLGAGKTTLLNHILSQEHGRRIAVVENEFGEIPVDHHLIVGADDDIFEMSNGCICCSVRTDLIETLNRLLERHDRFDYVLIEATGLASPGPIAQAFLVEDELRQQLKLDGVVTVVDCLNVQRQLQDLDVVWEQIAFSNVLLMNKTDLVGREVVAAEQCVRAINPTARMHRTRNAVIGLEQILNLGGFEMDEELERPDAAHDHGEAHPGAEVMSVSLEFPGAMDENRFKMWLQMLLITEGMDVFRAKGVLHQEGEDHRCLFQSVYMMYESQPGRAWETDSRLNRMVFIGRDLNRDRLEQGARSCLV